MLNSQSKHGSKILGKLKHFYPFILRHVANVVQIAKGKAYTIWRPAFQNTLWMLQQRLREGGFAQRCKEFQFARRWREGDHHQEFKDSLRGEQERGQLDHMVGVGAGTMATAGMRRCAVCSPRLYHQPTPVLSQPLPCQGLNPQRESARVRRRSGSVLKSMEIERLLEDLKKPKVDISTVRESV